MGGHEADLHSLCYVTVGTGIGALAALMGDGDLTRLRRRGRSGAWTRGARAFAPRGTPPTARTASSLTLSPLPQCGHVPVHVHPGDAAFAVRVGGWCCHCPQARRATASSMAARAWRDARVHLQWPPGLEWRARCAVLRCAPCADDASPRPWGRCRTTTRCGTWRPTTWVRAHTWALFATDPPPQRNCA